MLLGFSPLQFVGELISPCRIFLRLRFTATRRSLTTVKVSR
jgi:hypothetical protein